MKFTCFGLLKSLSSWAKVARELSISLIRAGADLNFYERRGFLYDPDFPLEYDIKSRITNEFSGVAVFTFEHPRNYPLLPAAARKIGLLVYEFTRLPDLWVENIEKYLDVVLVPSRFTRNVFLKSGVSGSRVKILRYGFNPDFYYPDGRKSSEKEKFNFLCVSSPHKREALYETIAAFKKAFPGNGGAKLTVKTPYLAKSFKVFEDKRLVFPGKNGGDGNFGGVTLIRRALSEKQMGDLQRGCDCYFSLCSAESFGLPFLEALACGKPVIALDWGGQRDFLNQCNACFVKHELSETSGHEYEKTPYKQFIARADLENAAAVVRKVYEERGGLKKPSLFPSAEYYHWDSVARDFLEIAG